jgi:hypothetical protein
VSLLVDQDNLSLFPTEQRRVKNAALFRSLFRTEWIASGRPPLAQDSRGERASVREGAPQHNSGHRGGGERASVCEGAPQHNSGHRDGGERASVCEGAPQHNSSHRDDGERASIREGAPQRNSSQRDGGRATVPVGAPQHGGQEAKGEATEAGEQQSEW